MKVVIVEDDDALRALLGEAVRERGHEVVSFPTGEAAWISLQTESCTLLLTDWRLPGIDGLELCRRVRQLPWGRDVLIVVVTGRTGPADLAAALDAGADDFLAKPFDLALLDIRLTIAERQMARLHARLEVEATLARSEARFRALTEHATDLVGVIAADETISYASPAYEHLLGYRPEEVVGQRVLTVMHPDDVARMQELFTSLLQADGPLSAEFRLRHRDGSWRHMETTAVNHLSDPAVGGIIATTRDVTVRKQDEEALRQSEARLRAQFQGLPVPTYIWQRQGDDWVLVDYNRAAEQITEGTIHTLLGTTAHALYGHLPEVWDNFTRCWTEHTTIEQEMPYRFQLTGMEKDLVMTYVFVPPDMVLVHTIDVTERTRAQAAVIRYVEQLSALSGIDRAIINSLDLSVTLDVFLAETAAQLDVDAAQVLLLNKHTQVLESAAHRGFRTPSVPHLRLRLGQGHAGRAALERRLISAPDLAQENLTRVPLVADEQFVAYIAVPLIAKGQVQGVLEIFHRTALSLTMEWLDFLEALAGQAAIAIDNATLFSGLQHSNTELALAYDRTIEGWSRALDLRDKETEGHSQRVTDLTVVLAQVMGMSDAELVHVRRGALLHDIGKMGIPDAILLKPGPLSEEEWVAMRRHPVFAYELLSPIAYLRPALDIPYCHHEKWDGTGYPRGLKGEQIPLAARIFAVVDVWDALRMDRPYRAAWSEEQTCNHIRALTGSHFDPAVVEAFLALLKVKD